jgi:hypothetical protein
MQKDAVIEHIPCICVESLSAYNATVNKGEFFVAQKYEMGIYLVNQVWFSDQNFYRFFKVCEQYRKLGELLYE